MAVINDFIEAASALIKWGPSANGKARDEMSATVTKLGSTLDRALQLAIIYLQATRDLDTDSLRRHLLDSREKLLHTCNEFEICGELYRLGDRFGRVFDPVKGAVTLGEGSAIQKLVLALRERERSVLDSIADDLSELTNAAAMPPKNQADRARLEERVDTTIANLEAQRILVKRTCRKIVDRM